MKRPGVTVKPLLELAFAGSPLAIARCVTEKITYLRLVKI
jgi:hypothetical protein